GLGRPRCPDRGLAAGGPGSRGPNDPRTRPRWNQAARRPVGRIVSTLLLVHAHPDDEAVSTGGAMLKAAADGRRVVLVTATRGEAGEIYNMDEEIGRASCRERGKRPAGGAARIERKDRHRALTDDTTTSA